VLSRLIALFPLWALGFAWMAYVEPGPFLALKGVIVYLLGLVMFGMGLTLTPRSFTAVLHRPAVVALGLALQFLVMPALAWALALAIGLPAQLLAGMVLVGASPGGTASNVICYLARGDVALSITMTAVSTLAAIALTPLLTLLYAGQSVDVPALAMLLDVLKIVILPVCGGLLLRLWLGHRLDRLLEVFPLVSVLAIALIIGIIVALNAAHLGAVAGGVVLAVMLHNLLGLAGGYGVARALRLDPATRRTLAIEVGMQNSGLAVALAVKYFQPVAALPGALFSIWHNLSGSALAAYWSRRAT
jgi:BASS family bile acid:Na+ symporter